jgi:hypothetical protein
MIEITKKATYTLTIGTRGIELTAEEINELHDKLTVFLNDHYRELNPIED